MKKLFISVLTCLCILSPGARAQTQFSGWLATNYNLKTGKKTSIHSDIQWRSSDEFKHTQTLLLRGGLNYDLTKKITVTAGYAFIHSRRVINNTSGYYPEHRIWEQVVYKHKLKAINVNHRVRLEQRFVAKSKVVNNELENDGFAYSNRLRYYIRNMLPLQRRHEFSKGLYAALQNEVFVNIGNTENVNGKFFDQNRFYLAVGYRVSGTFDIETGYLNQYTEGQGDAFTNNHVWQVSTYVRL